MLRVSNGSQVVRAIAICRTTRIQGGERREVALKHRVIFVELVIYGLDIEQGAWIVYGEKRRGNARERQTQFDEL